MSEDKKPKKLVIEFREPLKGWREPKSKAGLDAFGKEIKLHDPNADYEIPDPFINKYVIEEAQ